MARKRKLHWLWILPLVILAIGSWFFITHHAAWRHVTTDLFLRVSRTSPVASPCGAPLPTFSHGALAAARAAKFATLEQLQSTAGNGTVVRLQARLLGLQQQGRELKLDLGSMVNPNLTVAAVIPAAGCGASEEDQALYEELREVVALRFGSPRAQRKAPSQPTEVVVTGAVVHGSNGLELRPLLDLHVQ